MMLHDQFLHVTVSENGLVKSVCMLCGWCAGYSPHEDALRVAEKVHECSQLDESPIKARAAS